MGLRPALAAFRENGRRPTAQLREECRQAAIFDGAQAMDVRQAERGGDAFATRSGEQEVCVRQRDGRGAQRR